MSDRQPTPPPMPAASVPTGLAGRASSRLARWGRIAGVDFHIFVTLLFRGWSVLAGGLTAFLVPTFLDPAQQGYYYTFNSVLATQIFFELGLNHVLTQLAGHTAAHLQAGPDGLLHGERKWQQGIVSLLSLSKKWNAIMASLFFLALFSGGTFFFMHKGTLPASEWMPTWIVLVAATSCNLALSARLAICEGIGEVGQVARLRLRQGMLGYALLWVLLLSGHGLWAAAGIPVVSASMTTLWLRQQPQLRHLRNAAAHEGQPSAHAGYSWRKDVFPLQWKIALSWASGYFIFNFLTPVLFARQGPVSAGRLGLALTVFSAISTVGISWISAKIPTMSAHIARHERRELNALFDHLTRRSIGATAMCVALFLAVVHLAGDRFPSVLARLPSQPALLMLGLVTIANAFVFAMAAYMRAHKEEPLLLQSIVTALLIGVGVYWSAGHGLTQTVAAYAGIPTFIGLPWCAAIYIKYRQRSA